MAENSRGLFITFEGGDGSGKTTQIQLLQSFLQSQGYDVILTREPGGTSISEQIRQVLLDEKNTEMAPVTEVMLYAAARAQLVNELIQPAVEAGKIVICDRFLDSSIAYQGFGRGLGDMVEDINRHGVGDCMPDLTVYLRVDPDLARKRIGNRSHDRIEKESEQFHREVFRGYEYLQQVYPDRILAIEAAGSIEEISTQIKEHVMNRINGK